VPTSTHTSYLYDSLAETHKLKYKPKIFWFDENTVLLQLQTAEDGTARLFRTCSAHSD